MENTSPLVENADASGDECSTKSKPKIRGKKRKRQSSDSSTDIEDILPENTLEMEKILHASAVKNNLDDISVRKILKKVVTNDHVLALVKLREEEEEQENSGDKENKLRPKLTRSKFKELMRVSPKTASWNLELTPIKHIPVKTRPEVTALIAQELPEDEDDEEYEPTHDDAPSDDDQAMESCSDLDSQPRTPATPRSNQTTSPRVVKDGPFKVPQEITPSARKKLNLEEEEATIALRTRSKLSLSATSIEHIESTFVPPDDLPMPAVDDLWSQFLTECLDPAQTSKHEDDDEADPEYNVAADPDAHDEDLEALGNGIIKISKKELNDLVNELFNVMPDIDLADNLANSVLTDTSRTEVSGRWEGKQEPVSDDEDCPKVADRIKYEKNSASRYSIEKSKIEIVPASSAKEIAPKKEEKEKQENDERQSKPEIIRTVEIEIIEDTGVLEESEANVEVAPVLRRVNIQAKPPQVQIQTDAGPCILPEQIQILQQQLRQHIQLATSNFLQIYIHPVHWSLAPTFKEYLETLTKLHASNPNSVVNVCNLKPAMELVLCWEKTVAVDTPENAQMVKFIQDETERCRRRTACSNLFVGDFHETFKKVVANSPVFLYPYLLPAMPFRADNTRRFTYLRSEDELIALGLDEFWQYVESNPQVFKPRQVGHQRRRWGLAAAMQLVATHMFPWLSGKLLLGHVHNRRKGPDKDNPICKFFANREVTPVQHRLLPFNPKLTLYEQPEFEMPRIWVKYLAKTSKRFKAYQNRRTKVVSHEPAGVPIEIGQAAIAPQKKPLPIQFTKQIISNRANLLPVVPETPTQDKFDMQLIETPTTKQNTQNEMPITTNIFRVVNTSSGRYFMPVTVVQTNTVNCIGPIVTPIEVKTVDPKTIKVVTKTRTDIQESSEHCKCCILLRKLCKIKQTVITDYFRSKKQVDKKCPCSQLKNVKVSRKLRLLLNYYKSRTLSTLEELESKLTDAKAGQKGDMAEEMRMDCSLDELAYVTTYQLKLTTRMNVARNTYIKKKVYNILSSFKIDVDDPINLAKDLDKAFEVELFDLYKEFLGFLTAEQADKLDVFKDYFTRACVTDLLRKIEEQVKDKTTKVNILTQLNRVLMNNFATACEICSGLLDTMEGYPQLAEYVFSLFPHRVEARCKGKDKSIVPISEEKETQASTEKEKQASTEKEKQASTEKEKQVSTEKHLVNDSLAQPDDSQLVMEYEADDSSSDQEDSDVTSEQSEHEIEVTSAIPQQISAEPTSNEITENSEIMIDTPEITISKTEVQECDSSDMSMAIVSEDEQIKTEAPEWNRDEDKLILEVLKQHLTPKERNDKTILEIIEEKNIFEIVSNTLSYKSLSVIKERVLYLLELLLISENMKEIK